MLEALDFMRLSRTFEQSSFTDSGQNELFRNEGLAIEEISQYLEKSDNTSRTIIKSISSINGIVIRTKTISNKKYYHLDLGAFDEVLDKFLPTQQA